MIGDGAPRVSLARSVEPWTVLKTKQTKQNKKKDKKDNDLADMEKLSNRDSQIDCRPVKD